MGRNLFLLIVVGLFLSQAAFGETADKVHPALRARMLAADAEEFIPVNIRLAEQFDAYAFMEKARGLSKQERRSLLIEEASAFAKERQQDVLDALEKAEAGGAAKDVLPLWIVNMVHAKVKKSWIDGLAGRKGVEIVSWDRPFTPEMVADAAAPSEGDGGYNAIGWGVMKIEAPAVWALGYEGQGVVIANIDSGTDYNHSDLQSHIWNNPGEIPGNGKDDDNNGYVDDIMGWDFENNDSDPMDSFGHGTSTAGVAVGDGTAGTQTGVAPKADLMILKISGESNHMAAQQYALMNGADVATSSYSYKWYFSPKPNYHAFRNSSVMELAAGMIHTNSSSNDGSWVGVPWNISAPALCPPPWLHPEQVKKGDVAGTMGIGGSTQNDDLYSYSPIGPSTWEDLKIYDPGYPHPQNSNYWDYPHSTGDSLMKVDVVCPTEVPSTTKGGGYTSSFGGTSAATPHCGGACCLIISANPGITPDKVCQAIKMNAKDLGAPGLDTSFGAGRINVYEAVINVLTTLIADNPNPNLGDTVTFDMTGPAGQFYALLASQTLATVPLHTIGTFDIGLPWLILKTSNYDASGKAQYVIKIPKSPSVSGVVLHFQSITDDTAGTTGLYLISLHETMTIQ